MSLINVEPNPVIYSCYSEQNPDNYGFSGFCLLHESHVSIHCWPIEHTVDVDVFSCYQFNNEMALKYIENSFRGKAVNVSVCQRGHGMRNKHEIY
jgi:S-adenosylmethionine decarboxylase